MKYLLNKIKDKKKRDRAELILWLVIAYGIFVIGVFSDEIKCHAQEPQDTYINEDYVNYCEAIGKKYEICPYILVALIESESTGRPNAVSPDGSCKGLCQIKQGKLHNARAERLGVKDFFDPYGNILMCADYINELRYEKNGEDIAYVLGRYHGEKNPNKMSNYTKRILERSAELERVYYGGRECRK